MRKALALACLLAVGGCSRSEAPRTGSDALAKALRGLKAAKPCRTQIADEWAAGLPIPVRGRSGRSFKLFFYPLTGDPSTGPQVWSPAAEAAVDLDQAASPVCKVLPSAPRRVSGRRWPDGVRGLSFAQLEERKADLLRATEEVAGLYAAGKPEPAVRREFARRFRALAEPDLLPYYRELNPDFWDWLEGRGR